MTTETGINPTKLNFDGIPLTPAAAGHTGASPPVTRASSLHTKPHIPESILQQVEENLARGRRLAEEACSRYASAHPPPPTNAAPGADGKSSNGDATITLQRNLRLNQLRRSVSDQLRLNLTSRAGGVGGSSETQRNNSNPEAKPSDGNKAVPETRAPVGGVAPGSAIRDDSHIRYQEGGVLSPDRTRRLRKVSMPGLSSLQTDANANQPMHPILEEFGLAHRAKETANTEAVKRETKSTVMPLSRHLLEEERLAKPSTKRTVNDWLDHMVSVAAASPPSTTASKEGWRRPSESHSLGASPKAGPDHATGASPRPVPPAPPPLRSASKSEASPGGKARYKDWMDDIVEAAMRSAKATEARVMSDILSNLGHRDAPSHLSPKSNNNDSNQNANHDPAFDAGRPLSHEPSPRSAKPSPRAAWAEDGKQDAYWGNGGGGGGAGGWGGLPPSPLGADPKRAATAPMLGASPGPGVGSGGEGAGGVAVSIASPERCATCGRAAAQALDARLATLEEEYAVQQMLLRTALTRQGQLEAEREEAYAKLADLGQELMDLGGKNAEYQEEMKKTQQLCSEMNSGRRSARAALAEMASHNARLVAAFAEKKQEARRLQSDLEAEKERGAAAEASVEELEAALRSSQSEAAALRGKVADSAAQPPRESAHQLTRERAAWEAERAKLVAENESLKRAADLHRQQQRKAELSSQQRNTGANIDPPLSGGSASLDLEQELARIRSQLNPTSQPPMASGSADSSDGADPLPPQAREPAAGRSAGGGAGAASVVAPSPGLVTRITAENERLVGENARLKQAERMHSKRNEAEEHKIRGNNSFHQGKYKEAQEAYTQGLAVGLEDHKLNAVLHCNRSACYQGMRKYMEAIMDASRALQLDVGYLRAFQRRADAYLAIGDHQSAMHDFERLQALGCTDVHSKLADCRHKMRRPTEIDHYAVLEVPHNSTSGDIKQAYRQHALKHHPDKAPDNMRTAAEAVFKYVQKSYTVLSDAVSRKKYDNSLHTARFRYHRSYSGAF